MKYFSCCTGRKHSLNIFEECCRVDTPLPNVNLGPFRLRRAVCSEYVKMI